MEVSTAIQEYAEGKLKQLIDKFVTKPIEAHITFSVDRHHHLAHCSLSGGDGFSIEVEHKCGDMYGSVDKIIDKLAGQLKKKKDRLKDHKNKDSIKNMKTVGESDPEDPDMVSIDASDLVKFEEAKRRNSAS
tara:strand:+ start:345 stop:740 length:396 start_codon:yes stop_codon:yes gene_type:complete